MGNCGSVGGDDRGGTLLRPILSYTHDLLAQAIGGGDVAIDATVGNGHDTLFLAGRVGPGGHVYGFDIQAAAIEATRRRVTEAGLSRRVTLFLAGHERMDACLGLRDGPSAIRAKAVTFNLGYLPGSDKSLITRPETTLVALDAALRRLTPGGLMTVVPYPGHEGGRRETEAILDWARDLPAEHIEVLWYQFLNPRTHPPSLLAIAPRIGAGASAHNPAHPS